MEQGPDGGRHVEGGRDANECSPGPHVRRWTLQPRYSIDDPKTVGARCQRLPRQGHQARRRQAGKQARGQRGGDRFVRYVCADLGE
ncbi:hypothetical protein ACFFX0_30945 [Citricoccus parietis]|uniref:Uncharacterized protein n=1 Tax=Citricoccus parietis TaxID=592307 RepID=A0ABV5G8R6_9MICC